MEGMPTAKERLLLRSEGAAADSADANSAPAKEERYGLRRFSKYSAVKQSQ
jgi:hypothetical protein